MAIDLCDPGSHSIKKFNKAQHSSLGGWRSMKKNTLRSKVFNYLSGLCGLALVAAAAPAQPAVLPAFKVVAAPGLVNPTTADTYYCGINCTTSGTVDLWSNGYPPEITALASSLQNNVDLIYEYVRNNIEIVPMYGLQKGALGAIIDQSGTAFDQAQLMVDLLRASKYTASYQVGTITISGTQLANWLGTGTDPTAVTKILADGGIPATVTSSQGVVSSVTLSHVWVQVAIPGSSCGSTCLFDPAYKPHSFTNGIDLRSAMGYNDSTFVANGNAGATGGSVTATNNSNITAQYVTGVNENGYSGTPGIQSMLTTYATTLETYLKTTTLPSIGEPYAAGQIDDIVGRQDILPPTNIPATGQRITSLPYNGSAVQHTWTGDIPDVYRTTMEIKVYTPNGPITFLDRKLFVDQTYGRRLALDYYNYGSTVSGIGAPPVQFALTVDHQAVTPVYPGAGSPVWQGTTNPIMISVDHPYAAAASPTVQNPNPQPGSYMDQTEALGNPITPAANIESSIVFVTGFGDVSDRLYSKLTSEATNDWPLIEVASLCVGSSRLGSCSGNNGEPPENTFTPSAHDQVFTKITTQWMAQYSQMAKLQARIGGAVIQNHHLIGVASVDGLLTSSPSNVFSIDSAVSINTKTQTGTPRQAIAASTASAAEMLEGSVFEQEMDALDPASVSARFDWVQSNCASSTRDPLYCTGETNTTPRFYLLTSNANFDAQFSSGNIILAPPFNYQSVAPKIDQYLTDASLSGLASSTSPAQYSIIASDDSFLGPGNVCGSPPKVSGTSDVPCYSGTPISGLRGGAFMAFGTSGNSLSFAHVVTQRLGFSKGGGAGDEPIFGKDYDPTTTAQALRDRFKDSSKLLGVDLKSGDYTYTAPADITVGNGAFPYSLSFQRTFRASNSHSRGLSQGWTHNLDRRIAIGSDGLATMGRGAVMPAVDSLVTIYVSQQLYATQPSDPGQLLSRWVLEPFVEHWWDAQIVHNAVTVTAGADAQQFIRLPDGQFNPPNSYLTSGTSNWNLVQTGKPTPLLDVNGEPLGPWNYAGVSFTLTSPQKDVQTYPYWANSAGTPGQPQHGWHISTWTFPQGITATYTYRDGTQYTFPENDDALVKVTNSLGRSLTLNYTAADTVSGGVITSTNPAYSWDATDVTGCALHSIQPDHGLGLASYVCAPINNGAPYLTQFTSPASQITKYGYQLPAFSTTSGINFPDGSGGFFRAYQPCDSISGSRPQCHPYLTQVFLPSDTLNPKQVVGYDAVGHVNSYQDATSVLNPSQRGAYQFYITGSSRGERLDPTGKGAYEVYYDSWGRAIEFIDELGNPTYASYDGLNRVLTRTYPLGDQSSFTYDSAGDVLSLTKTPYSTSSPAVPASLVVSATYDANCGKIKTLTDAWGNTSGVNASAHTTTWTYDPTACWLNSVQQPAVFDGPSNTTKSPLTQYSYVTSTGASNYGLLTQVTDPSGLVVTYGYDNMWDLDSRTVDSGGLNLTTKYYYDSSGTFGQDGTFGAGVLTQMIDPNGDSYYYGYDYDRRMVNSGQVKQADGSCSATLRVFSGELLIREGHAEVCSPTGALPTTSNSTWAITNYQYTPTDKPWIVTDPSGYEDITLYDQDDRVTDAIRCLNAGSGANGTCPPPPSNSYQFLPQRDTHTDYNYDGTVSHIYKGWGTSDQITYATYSYDADGQVLTTTDANNNTTTNVFDGYERLWRTCLPDSKNLCSNTNASFLPTDFEQLTYDMAGAGNNGNVTSKQNRDGQAIGFKFDALNREIERDVPANSAGHFARTLTTTFDLASRKWAQKVVDTEQNTTAVPSTTQTLQNTYDTAKRLSQVSDSLLGALGTSVGTVGYGYDSSSNRNALNVYTSGAVFNLAYNYDDDNRLHTIQNAGTTLATFTPDPLSRLTNVTFADTSHDDYTYYYNNDLQNLTATYNGGSLNYGFTMNGAHQIIGKTISSSTYELQSNIANKNFTANSLNEIGAVNFTKQSYDQDGNLTGDGANTYEYDEENRLRLVTLSSGSQYQYDYDPQGRRRAKIALGTTNVTTWFVNDGPNEVAELNGSGVRQRLYINGDGMDDRIAESLDGGSTWSFFHDDYQKSAIFTTKWTPSTASTNGAIQSSYRYGPYGETNDVATGNPIRYAGRYLDAETGLYYYRARYYNPVTGRFLQTDPIGSRDNLDLYAYVGGDPVNNRDPLGTEQCHDKATCADTPNDTLNRQVSDQYTLKFNLGEATFSFTGSKKELQEQVALLVATFGEGAGVSAVEATPVVAREAAPTVNRVVSTIKATEQKLFGPFHRLGDSPEAIKAIQETGELKGNPARNYMPSPFPKVKAYDGALPQGKQGFTFYTDAAPDVGHVPGQPTWMPTRPGVVERDGQAIIHCIVTGVGC